MLTRLPVPDPDVRSLPARFALGVLVPQMVFYLGLRSGGLTAALVLAGGWAVGLQMYDLARRRVVDPFFVYGLLLTLVLCAAALFARSPAVYAGAGIVENVLSAALLVGTMVFCPRLLLKTLTAIVGERAVLRLSGPAILWPLTALWVVLLLVRSAGLYIALRHLTIGQFLFVNTVAGWPLNGLGVLLSLVYLRGHMDARDIIRGEQGRADA
ncbi:MAG: DUF3159 domain-containing protein [bacterium]